MLLGLRSRLSSWFALAGLLAGLGAAAAHAGEAPRPVVVELYTSQGCSSCPPADALLGRLAQRPDVLALSLPVTYWDMLGWKDTLASPGNTSRQKAYADAMGRGGVYTPQIVVDGINDIVGSRENDVRSAVAAREADMQAVPVTVTLTPAEVHVEVGAAKSNPGGYATIWMFRIRPEATVKIGAGENGGRTVTYRNVVRTVEGIGLWKGKPVSLDLPRSAMGGGMTDGIAVVVQQKGHGRILGASHIDLPQLAHAR